MDLVRGTRGGVPAKNKGSTPDGVPLLLPCDVLKSKRKKTTTAFSFTIYLSVFSLFICRLLRTVGIAPTLPF